MQVFRIAYCQKVRLSTISESQRVCEEFAQAIKDNFPELQKKVKIHLILHLTQSMTDFGPTSAFNTERYNIITLKFCWFYFHSSIIMLKS